MPNDKIQFLINNLAESLEVEVKNWLGGLQTNDEKSKLAKEIIALANNGGGYVFVGFEDEGDGHPEIEPEEGQIEAFSQDAVAAVVARYISPPCQCEVGLYQREGSEILHPVITVPGNHRTPVWAQRGSPDNTTLRTGVVYVRRPGGSSEPAQNQDDWEKVLERLVKARQSEQLDAIREIMNPTSAVVAEAPALEAWKEESELAWQRRLEPLPEHDARCLTSGYWTVSFSIESFENPSLRELNAALEREMPSHSGWPPFTYIHREPLRPVADGDVIEAWLANNHDVDGQAVDADHADFWRVSRDGRGFLLRPMQEDGERYLSNRIPRPEGRFFDWVLPIYRSTEVLKFIEALAHRFSDHNATFDLEISYCGMMGRSLQQHDLRYNLWSEGTCRNDVVSTRLTGPINEIGLSLEEKVYQLLSPVYEQFDFTNLPKNLVDNVVRDALSFR